MEIGVLTWHKTINHGAILQAYALQNVFKNLGHNVIELDYNRKNDNMDDAFFKKVQRKFKRFNYYGLLSKTKLPNWEKFKKQKFEKFRKENFILGKMYNEEKIDVVAIGSDMVFDFYEGYNPFMYGKDVNANFIFSYAACFGYVTEELFSKYSNKDEVINLINKLDGISYRDNNTEMILKKCCNIKECTKVIDPVLLYGFNKERKLWADNNWKEKKYLLIYSYTYNMDNNKEVKAIKKFAQKKGLDIVSVGYFHPWCDKNINADPKEFIELFENAKYIVTDTFHGTVFSITFNKQFATLVRNNAFKIIDLLKDLELESRANNDIDKSLIDLESNPIDYAKVNKIIEVLRKKSMNFIKEKLKEAEKNDKK